MTGFLVWSAASPALADQVYKSVDAQGHVIFSDRPIAAGAQKTNVAVQQADPKEAERLAKERMLLKADDDQRTQKAAADAKARTKQDDEKKKLCEQARMHYNDLKSATRLYAPTADGNREFYSDTQADAMRAEAKRAMDAACGS
jgi:C4-dicarboxylate-specific signal transduction histidine kinase